ncbi:hypothetical protein ACFE04_027836 [Oxalis oulophora]
MSLTTINTSQPSLSPSPPLTAPPPKNPQSPIADTSLATLPYHICLLTTPHKSTSITLFLPRIKIPSPCSHHVLPCRTNSIPTLPYSRRCPSRLPSSVPFPPSRSFLPPQPLQPSPPKELARLQLIS